MSGMKLKPCSSDTQTRCVPAEAALAGAQRGAGVSRPPREHVALRSGPARGPAQRNAMEEPRPMVRPAR